MGSTMEEVIVHPSTTLHTSIHSIPIPLPGPNEVVIRVHVAGSNPKDWDHITNVNISLNSGDDLAGTIHSLGSEVGKTGEFRVGDRVGGFHEMMAKYGAFAEYAVVPASTVLRLSDGVGFEEAATIPLILTTAAITLFRRQHLPPPWSPFPANSAPTPLIVYGASPSLGTAILKLAKASNIHPLIAIAGSSTSHLTPILDASKGDTLIDYRGGINAMKAAVKDALKGLDCHHAVDAITSRGSPPTWVPLSQMLTPSTDSEPTHLSVVSGGNKYDEPEIQPGVDVVYTYVGTAHSGAYRHGMPKQPRDIENVSADPEWVWVLFRYASRMLADGRLSGHPFEVVEGGLRGVEKGLNLLKAGKARGVKYIFRVVEV